MKKIGICIAIVICLLSVNVMAEHMDGFVNMEDFAAFTAGWQDPLQMADLELFADYWLTYYLPDPSLAWWDMEEASGAIVYDLTANEYDLVPTGGFVISESASGSMVGSGMRFDGSGQRLTQPTLLDDMPDAMTIAGWVKPDATGMNALQCWFSKQNTDGINRFWLTFKMNGTHPSIIAANGTGADGGYFNCNTTIKWEDDTWYHIAFTWDSSGCKLYVNGQLEGSDSLPIMGDMIADRNPIDLTIGTGGDMSKPFKGVVDDVRIYDRVLSEADILYIHDSAPGVVYYDLIVNAGTGDGSYAQNAAVNIAADPPLVDLEFDAWTGDTATVADTSDPTTTVNMPASAVTVTAVYKAETLYALTVGSGSGGGNYTKNTVTNIIADAAPAGQEFDVWTGDTAYIADIDDPTTTVTMPASAISVTATYRPLYALIVCGGTGTGSYTENSVIDIAADAPSEGMVFDVWFGEIAYVTDMYDSTTTITMPADTVGVMATYKAATYYSLTVNSGSGGGSYVENTAVNISAGTPPAGQMFDAWTGDTSYVTNVYDATTTVTMPTSAATVTATYKTIPASMVITVQADFPGGNALINGTVGTKVIEGSSVIIEPDLRLGGNWFYWCFETVANKPGQVTFNIPSDDFGFRGPAVSYDNGDTWDWMGTATMTSDSFTHTFTADQLTVRFAVTLSYLQKDLDKFLADNASNPHLSRSLLTKSRGGLDVDLLQIGQPGVGKKAVLFTCRHHACETTASYLLEGFMKEVISESPEAVAFRDSYVLYVVPIVDADGVEAGDQGKNSYPHDHNRDYGINYYTEITAIEALRASKNLRLVMDWHCPMLTHDYFHFLGSSSDPAYNDANVDALALLIKNELPSTAPGGPVNSMGSLTATANSGFFSLQPGIIMSTTLEVPYASPDRNVDPASFRSYGADILRAWVDMTFQSSTVPVNAWWEMEETSGTVAYDSLSNSYDLSPEGGLTISGATIGGMFDNGFLFDGTGSRLTHPTLLDSLPEAITITGWVKPDATGMSGPQCWFSKQNIGGNQDQLWLRFNMDGGTPGVIGATLRSHGVSRNVNSSITWADDTWYHYAFTWDSSGCSLYVNGVLEISDITPIMRNGTYTDLTIGTGSDTSQPFKGIIDDVRIYDDALTAPDIMDLYNLTP